jgi:hypothetical protein
MVSLPRQSHPAFSIQFFFLPSPTRHLRGTKPAKHKLIDAFTTFANSARSSENAGLEAAKRICKLPHTVGADVTLTTQARPLRVQLVCLSHRRLLDGAHVVLDLSQVARVCREESCHVLSQRLEVVADEVHVVCLVPGRRLRLATAVGGWVVDVLRRHAEVVNDANAAVNVDLVLLGDVLVLLNALRVDGEALVDFIKLLCDDTDIGAESLQQSLVVREECLNRLAVFFLLRDQSVDLLNVALGFVGEIVEASGVAHIRPVEFGGGFGGRLRCSTLTLTHGESASNEGLVLRLVVTRNA